MKYKTPPLQKFVQHMCMHYPMYRNDFMQLDDFMAQIDLNVHIPNGETFCQPVDLYTGGTIELVWNIDSVIEFSKQHPEKLMDIPVFDILNSPRFEFSSPNSIEVQELVRYTTHHKMEFQHKIPYIIIALAPFVENFCIIDGNHRFFEAVEKKQEQITCFMLLDDECIPFLQPESQKYIHGCLQFENIILGKL